jgi:hypothetical protein
MGRLSICKRRNLRECQPNECLSQRLVINKQKKHKQKIATGINDAIIPRFEMTSGRRDEKDEEH